MPKTESSCFVSKSPFFDVAFRQLLNTRLVSTQFGSSALGSQKHLIRPYPEPSKFICVHTSPFSSYRFCSTPRYVPLAKHCSRADRPHRITRQPPTCIARPTAFDTYCLHFTAVLSVTLKSAPIPEIGRTYHVTCSLPRGYAITSTR
jgi:hypothetical protein